MILFRGSYSLVFILILLTLLYGCAPELSCTTTKSIDASLSIVAMERRMVGFNTDTDSLRFGVVTSGSLVERSIIIQYDHDADVSLRPEGDLRPWMSMEPAAFFLPANATQQVNIGVNVPIGASPGNYTGVVHVCFRDT